MANSLCPEPRTAFAALLATARHLREAGIENPRLEAEVLVRAVLGISKERLFAHPETELSAEAEGRLQSFVSRRARREPLPYLLGTAEFYSLTFRITPAALIPRPETEILAEEAMRRAEGARLAIDVGSGSGALSVVLARGLPEARVVAIDLSQEALLLTRENAAAHGVGERVLAVRGDLLSAIRAEADLVVANLPYIPHDDMADLQPEVRDFEPRLALDGGHDGLEVIRRLSVQLSARIRPGGFAALEVGAGQAEAVVRLLVAAGFGETETVPDYAGIGRVVIGRQRGER